MRIVVEDYQQPDVKLDYYGGTADTYAGFDRFGRVIRQLWYDFGPGALSGSQRSRRPAT